MTYESDQSLREQHHQASQTHNTVRGEQAQKRKI